jgi:hypothetical protein
VPYPQYHTPHSPRSHAAVGYDNYISLQAPEHFPSQHPMYLPHLAVRTGPSFSYTVST